MDKQNTVVLASGGVNLAINLMLFYYVHRRTNLLNRKLDEILTLLNAMNKAAAPQPQQRMPFPMRAGVSPPYEGGWCESTTSPVPPNATRSAMGCGGAMPPGGASSPRDPPTLRGAPGGVGERCRVSGEFPHGEFPQQYMSQYGMYNPAAAAAMQAQAPPPPTMGNPGAVNNMAHTLSNMMDSMIGIGVRARPSPSTVVITEEKQQQSGGAADISNELRELQNEEISP
jgi:hypothetical protein